MENQLAGEVLVPGHATGALIWSSEPLSFWGGYDALTGEIIDRRHPLSGTTGSHRIVAIPGTRGSSTTTAVLIEAFRRDTAPAGFLVTDRDTFLALAAVVADEMYQKKVPVVMLDPDAFSRLQRGRRVTITPDGGVALNE